MSYDFELDRVRDEIKKRNPKRVLLQFPEGLRVFSYNIVASLRADFPDVEFVVSAEPSWGACDLADDEAIALKADLIVHFGHTPYPWYVPKTPTVYVPTYSKLEIGQDLLNQLEHELDKLGAKKVNLSATLQHIKLIPKVKEYLARKFEVRTGMARPPFMLEGQILGCDLYAVRDDSDAYVTISGGTFHPLGVALATLKPTLKLDPYEGKVVDVTRDAYKVLKVRMGKVMEAKEARIWGIIQGLKTGQNRPTMVKSLKEGLERLGKEVLVFTSRVTTSETLRNLPGNIEAFVVTSCPRVPVDDLYEFEKPVLTPGEAKMIILNHFDKYIFPW